MSKISKIDKIRKIVNSLNYENMSAFCNGKLIWYRGCKSNHKNNTVIKFYSIDNSCKLLSKTKLIKELLKL